MKKNYRFETELNKIIIAPATRMLLMLGEGELEVINQGRFDHSQSFSQETEAIGQHSPRTGEQRPKLARELSAWMRANSDSTPHFFCLESTYG